MVFLVPPQVLARFSSLDFGFFGTSSGFGNIFPENLAKTSGGTKKKILETSKPKTSETLFFFFGGFFGTSSGFGKMFISRLWFFWYLLRFWQYFFFLKTLPKPEEVPKKKNSGGLQAPRLLELCFFQSFWYLLRFWQRRFWFFWYPLRFWHDFIAKTCGKETPSKNERNPGMKDFSLISNETFRRIRIKENPPEMRSPGMMDFSWKLHPKMKNP